MWLLFLCIVFVSVNGLGEDDVNAKDWWQSALFYQIYPRSFMDSNGDGIGDLNGISLKLPYLKDLGVNAIILAPIFKSPLNDFGFDIADMYNIHHEYGSMEDMENLIKRAYKLGIKVVLDIVINHTSNESEWFIKSANKEEYYTDWYIWETGHLDETGRKSPPNNWISVFNGSAWSHVSSREEYFLHQFSTSEPELNLRNPVVVEEFKSIIKFWLEKGIAGIRMNAMNYVYEIDRDMYMGAFPDEPESGKPGVESTDYKFLDHIYTKDQSDIYDLVSQFRDVFDAITLRDNLTRVLMTEASTSIKNTVRYYGTGNRAGAHIPLNFGLVDDLKGDIDARDVKRIVDKWLTYKPLDKPANWMIGNHDKSRIASRFRPELVDAFNILALLLPGIAVTYMGEEIGMKDAIIPWVQTKDFLACKTDNPVNYVDVSRDPARAPFQWGTSKNAGFSTADFTWLPVAHGFESLNMETQRVAVRSHYLVYRALVALRQRPAFTHGRFDSIAVNRDVFAFKRWYKHDSYVILINFGKGTYYIDLSIFDLIFGNMEVEISSIQSSKAFGDTASAKAVELDGEESLVLRMQV